MNLKRTVCLKSLYIKQKISKYVKLANFEAYICPILRINCFPIMFIGWQYQNYALWILRQFELSWQFSSQYVQWVHTLKNQSIFQTFHCKISSQFLHSVLAGSTKKTAVFCHNNIKFFINWDMDCYFGVQILRETKGL